MATNPGRRGRASGGPFACNRLGRAWLGLVLLLAGAASAFAQPATVHSRLSTGTISIDESVNLIVEASGLDGELDIAVLEEDFEVISRSSSRDVSIVDGERRSTVTWVLELVPREVGVFTVPPVTVGGVEGELLSLTVTEAPTGGERLVFVEAEVDDDTPWVQSQVILTLRVFRAIDIVDGALGEPEGEGLDVRPLGEDRTYTVRRDGRDYVVVERRFALFPQRSGEATIKPVTLSVTVPSDPSRVRGFFSPTRRLTRRTEAIALAVQARPSDFGGWWLPAKEVSITEDWPGSAEARVGEPLTRTVRVEAQGVLAAQLPDIEPPSVDGLALYADDPVRADTVGSDGVRAAQTLSLAVIPSREGEFELPPVRLEWFDVARGEPRTATLPARSVTVLPGDATSASSPPLTDTASSLDGTDGSEDESPGASSGASAGTVGRGETMAPSESATRWRTIAFGAIAGWMLTVAAFLLQRRPRSRGASPRTAPPRTPGGTPAEREARQRLQRAAREADLAAFAKATLARAAVRWPDAPPRNLSALSRRLDPAAGLAAPLAALDAALYRPPSSGGPSGERSGDPSGGQPGDQPGGSRAPNGVPPCAPLGAEALSALAERLEPALRSVPPRGGKRATDDAAGTLPPL